ncbi:MAG: alanine racemase [Candidatus Sumerlaeaceae bacterium]|nr:alanine racemase [Candidatus Sumerlaeaceae bacterium]
MTEERVLDAGVYLTRAEVDLSAIRHNFRVMRRLTSKETKVFAVIKANAYGHGAVMAARALEAEQPDAYCVARAEEALELRSAGIARRILVLGPPFLPQAEQILRAEAESCVCDPAHLEAVTAAAKAQAKRAKVHLKVDIGMGRLGVRPADAVEMARRIAKVPDLELAGVMSHFPCADSPPADRTLQEIAVFETVQREIAAAGIHVPLYHAANSAATLDFPTAHFDAVRTGICLYGIYPGPEVGRRVDLQPAMSVFTRILYVKDVAKGTGLSYGHTFIAPSNMRVATLALGYADGYPRHASNRTVVAVNGQFAPVVGRVCMDLTLIDVTKIPNVQVGDEVLLWGKQSQVILPADAVAAAAGTIGYEMTTRLGQRVPRFYR